MSELFKRVYSLTVGNFPVPLTRAERTDNPNAETVAQQIKITGLRVEFKISKSLEKEPNTLDLRVTNLSADTRKKLFGKGVPVTLTAGYPGSDAVIFSGDSRTIDHVDSGHGDFYTHIQCGDGERLYSNARFKKNFGPGVQVADVIRECAKTLSLNAGNLDDALGGGFRGGLTHFAKGYTASGNSVEIFNSLIKTIGFTWSVQGGALQILKDGQAINTKAIFVSKDTGMIGSPDHSAPDKKGGKSVLKIKSLLQPQFRCGGPIVVESVGTNGQFVVKKLRHLGDTHGQEWYSELEATPV